MLRRFGICGPLCKIFGQEYRPPERLINAAEEVAMEAWARYDGKPEYLYDAIEMIKVIGRAQAEKTGLPADKIQKLAAKIYALAMEKKILPTELDR